MSFYDLYCQYRDREWEGDFAAVSEVDVEGVLRREHLTFPDFLVLLSPAAEGFLEPMAQKARALTLRYFGRTIQLYAPLYVSDYCENSCLYCSFSAKNRRERRKLSLPEVNGEAAFIAATGLQHILLLTGESKKKSPVGYLRDCAGVLKRHFSSIAIEVYPLSEEDYASLVAQGVDGLTLYQETYDENLYRVLHPAGPKGNFRYRLEAPERGAAARMRQVNIGALLGLADWRREVLMVGLHARYLQDRFPDVEIGASVPRLRPFVGAFQGSCEVNDQNIVQIILALRLFLPRLGIALSTREDSRLRDCLIPLGITRMSAGSATSVGGYTTPAGAEEALPQFEIADSRSVPEIMARLRERGYDPVLKDWIPGI
ncbi:tyrosine lyase ThiH [Syntrophus gentianae]|uniref:Tyrosine lyase ThiH n=1 Tax=Syntrophus gentianae TaxID=43775 RepID=A0A1H7YDC5_9BACT|nr:2-iminoacetate synthase ThiH [Syntrophus gentianae]SEM43337.1 tyrosine lyase ThiH [Syntrophus gentianae]